MVHRVMIPYKPIVEVLLRVAAVCVLAAGVLTLVGCDYDMGFGQPGQAHPATQQPAGFAMGVEQDGRRVPAGVNHIVRIRRAPFAMTFFFDQLGTMLTQASTQPEIILAAERGVGLDRLLPAEGTVSEGLMNPEKLLVVSDRGRYHNLLCLGPKTHRFDPEGVVEIEQKGFLCRRTVRELLVNGRAMPVERYPHKRLFLTFIQAERSPGHRRHVERRRDWLVIEFID